MRILTYISNSKGLQLGINRKPYIPLMAYMVCMETKKEIRFSGVINPKERTARFQEKLDKQGRVQVPRVVRDKLGLQDREAILEVHLKVEEIYNKEETRNAI